MGIEEDRFYKLSLLISLIGILSCISPYAMQIDFPIGLMAIILITKYRNSWMLLYLVILVCSIVMSAVPVTMDGKSYYIDSNANPYTREKRGHFFR